MLYRDIVNIDAICHMIMEILVDEMYDGLDDKLNGLGYKTSSVKKLKDKEKLMGHDFNVISYIKEHKMVLVTKDNENGKACIANNFACVFVNDDKIFEKIILEELRMLKNKL